LQLLAPVSDLPAVASREFEPDDAATETPGFIDRRAGADEGIEDNVTGPGREPEAAPD